MGVDTLHAAGAAAKVPSRLGKETEAVLGATQPDGSTLKGNEAAAAVDDEKDVTQDGFDKDHELRYGPRRTAVLFFLMAIAGVGVWLFFRWRSRRRQDRFRKLKGKGRAGKSRRSKREGGIRLETGRAPEAAPVYRDPEPFETAPIFDVGDEEEDEEAQGDMGRSADPWRDDQK